MFEASLEEKCENSSLNNQKKKKKDLKIIRWHGGTRLLSQLLGTGGEAAGRADVQGQAQQHSKSEASLGYTILGLRKKKIKKQHAGITALEKLRQRIPSMNSPQ